VPALIALLVVVAFAIAGCGGSGSTAAEPSSTPTAEQRAFTVAELAEFDGKDGRAAYIAVDGVVYDVSDSRNWPEGVHTRCDLNSMAGNDLSAEIEQAPANMRALLQQMPVVGSLE
jgi:predicted heme/steroid binding protein